MERHRFLELVEKEKGRITDTIGQSCHTAYTQYILILQIPLPACPALLL